MHFGFTSARRFTAPTVIWLPVTKSRANGPVCGVAAGPDGSMWFERCGSNKIGRIAPNGLTKEFSVPSDVPSTPGNGVGLLEMAAGPDGNMWFTAFFANFIGKITPSGVITTYPIPTANSHPYGIAAGPDGNLWFAENFTNAIGRITPEGVITEFAIPDVGSTGPATITEPKDCIVCGFLITAGPDGAMWFTMPGASRIGDITAGADGSLWFSESDVSRMGRITLAGAITEYTTPAPSSTSPPLLRVRCSSLQVRVAACGSASTTSAGWDASRSQAPSPSTRHPRRVRSRALEPRERMAISGSASSRSSPRLPAAPIPVESRPSAPVSARC